MFRYAWPKLRELNADIVDEHCYAKPDWFFNNTHRYDNYDRKGPKVFFGEYAAQSDKIVSVLNRNNLECAISQAAFMASLERNAEVVRMASYAPLFAHMDGWQWTPNLIWVDNLRSYGTLSCYVQKLFANHRGDAVLPVKLDSGAGKKLYASAARDEASGEVILKFVNGDESPSQVQLSFKGLNSPPCRARNRAYQHEPGGREFLGRASENFSAGKQKVLIGCKFSV